MTIDEIYLQAAQLQPGEERTFQVNPELTLGPFAQLVSQIAERNRQGYWRDPLFVTQSRPDNTVTVSYQKPIQPWHR